MEDGSIKNIETELYSYTIIRKGDRIKLVKAVKKWFLHSNLLIINYFWYVNCIDVKAFLTLNVVDYQVFTYCTF